MDLGPSKTVVIVGAGASHDCLVELPHELPPGVGMQLDERRPPLTSGLVVNTPFTRSFLRRHRGAETVVDWLEAEMHHNPDEGLEMQLARYVDSSADRASAEQRLLAFSRYVRDLITAAADFVAGENVGGSRTAYTRLARLLEQQTGVDGPILVINFNYDSLCDHAIAGALAESFAAVDHTAEPSKRIRLAKPHGCVHWYGGTAEDPATWRYGGTLLDPPPIALPVANKDQWMCPDSHKDAIGRADPERIIMIGWRAADPLVLEKLAEGRSSSNPVALDIVTLGDDSVAEVLRHVEGGPIQFQQPRTLTKGLGDAVRQHHLDSLILDPTWDPPGS